MDLFNKTEFDLDYKNSNKTLDKFVFFLCLLRAKKYSEKWVPSEEYEYFTQYCNFLKARNIRNISNLAKQEPYRTIIEEWSKPGIDRELQKLMFREFNNKCSYDKDKLESDLKFMWKMIMLLCVFCFFHGVILILWWIGSRMPVFTVANLPHITACFLGICYFIHGVRFFRATKDPENHMNDWYFFYVHNRTCRKMLESLYKKIGRQ